MGETEIPHFHEIGIFERFQTPKTNILYLLKHQDTTTKSREIPETCSTNNILINLEISQFHVCDIFGKDGHQQIPNNRPIKS